MYGVACWRI